MLLLSINYWLHQFIQRSWRIYQGSRYGMRFLISQCHFIRIFYQFLRSNKPNTDKSSDKQNTLGTLFQISCRFSVTLNSCTRRKRFSSFLNFLGMKSILTSLTQRIRKNGSNLWHWSNKSWNLNSTSLESLIFNFTLFTLITFIFFNYIFES